MVRWCKLMQEATTAPTQWWWRRFSGGLVGSLNLVLNLGVLRALWWPYLELQPSDYSAVYLD